VAVATVTSRQK